MSRGRAAAAVASALLMVALLVAAAPASAATRTVTTTANSGPGSLRATIAAAAPNDTVVVPQGTYTLGSEIPITKKLTITGAGAGQTVVSGADAHRIFKLTGASGVTIARLGVTHARGAAPSGIVHGSAIWADPTSSLTLDGVALTASRGDASGASGAGGGIVYGGAIDSDGPLTIRN